jgi:hypothetical protein
MEQTYQMQTIRKATARIWILEVYTDIPQGKNLNFDLLLIGLYIIYISFTKVILISHTL